MVRYLLIAILFGIMLIPIFALGGVLGSSLIEGKSLPEAIEILAEQIDSLLIRMEAVETDQTQQAQSILEIQAIINQWGSLMNETPPKIEYPQEDFSELEAAEALRLKTLSEEVLKLRVPIDYTPIPDHIREAAEQLDREVKELGEQLKKR